MTHKYYEEDHDMNNESRLKYFDDWFKVYAKEMAKEKGMTLSSYLAQIKNFTTFKAVLKEVFSLDNSLANYVEGMSQRSFRLFYDRSVVQDIVEANKEEDEEYFEELEEETPVDVQQAEKEVEEYFKGVFVEKKTGKEKKVVAKKETVKVRGKDQVRYRDAKGRWVKKS
jgi:hypothetical protein